jgi:hypothetical protein
LGMIWSVSTLATSSGAALAVRWVKGVMGLEFLLNPLFSLWGKYPRSGE